MKRFFSLILCLAICVPLSGCSRRRREQLGTTDTSMQSSEVATAETTAEESTAVSGEAETENNGREIPLLSIGSATLQNSNNTMILKYLFLDYPESSSIRFTAEDYAYTKYLSAGLFVNEYTTYEITELDITREGAEFTSSVSFGQIIGEGSEEYFAYTVNCNAVKNKIYNSSEILADSESWYSAFCAGEFSLVRGNSLVCEDMTPEEIVYAYRPELGILPDFYVKDGGTLGVVIDVPQAYGGYALFECEKSELLSPDVLNCIAAE